MSWWKSALLYLAQKAIEVAGEELKKKGKAPKK